MTRAWLPLIQILLFVFPVSISAHADPGCCGDIPESLIWILSFFVLIGILVVVSSYFLFPSPPEDWAKPPTAVAVRIDKRDIVEIARAVAEYDKRTLKGFDT